MAYNARMPAPVRELAESPQSSAAAASLYARDLYFWSREQAAALGRRDSGAIDWDNVTEEIESLGSEQEHRWTSLAARTVEHLLKIQHWHGAQASTLFKWRHEVRTWRSGMARVIRKNPSLQGAYGMTAATTPLRAWWRRAPQSRASRGPSTCAGSGSSEFRNSAPGR